jgi:hypothetical protein
MQPAKGERDRGGKKVQAMKPPRMRLCRVRDLLALLCSALLVTGDPVIYAQPSTQDAASQEQADPKIPNDQLDSLVAPIALYPDPLLAQVLAASTYPLEIIQLQQWLQQHKDLKDKALVEAVQKQDWDPSVQAMAPLPDALKQLAENLKWTTDLGNAFLAQQADVMDAVQRMRAKAKDAGNLKSTEQQKVETKVVESKSVVVIEQANPQVIYVPSYNPTVVYGPPVYPYPPITYPPPGYYAAGVAISFGIGLAMGAAWGGGWGYGCGWGGGGNNNITINNNNNFVSNSNRTNVNNRSSTRTGGGNWQHNPQHRGAAPYSNRATANRYGGTARGDSVGDRQANARQNQGQRDQGQRGDRQRDSAPDRGLGGRQQSGDRGGAGRPQAGTTDRGGGGADRVGNRQVPNTPSGSNKSAFSGASKGTSGSAARTSSQRGSSSMGGSRGGGSRGGGGGRRR